MKNALQDKKVFCLVSCSVKGWLVFLFFHSQIAFATLEQDVEKIMLLIEQQQSEQAYQFALANAFEHEGLIEFDYALGLAAQASRHFNQAVFAFERVVKSQPLRLLPRYALATSYFSAGNLVAAQLEFEQIKAVAEPKQFPNINNYLHAINKALNRSAAQWENFLDLGVGFDSNANSGIDDEVIFVPLLGQVSLFDSSQTLDDNFLQVQLQSNYIKPLNLNSHWYALGKIRYADYQDNPEMSRLFADFLTGYQRKINKNTFTINGFYRPMWLGSSWSTDNKYLDYYGLTAGVAHSLYKNSDYGLDLTYAQLDYEQKDLNRSQLLANLWYRTNFEIFSSKITLSLGQEAADDTQFKHLGRDFLGASYQISKQLNNDILLKGQLDYIYSDYQADHPLFAEQRVDSTFRASIDYQQYFAENWSWLVKAIYIDNQSELVIYDYQRTVISTAVRYQF